jgi:hypothetical protein
MVGQMENWEYECRTLNGKPQCSFVCEVNETEKETGSDMEKQK